MVYPTSKVMHTTTIPTPPPTSNNQHPTASKTSTILPLACATLPKCSYILADCLAIQFQKAFVLNLAERPDKLDAFALASTLTGFNAEVIQGVRGEEVVNKALPSLEGIPEVHTPFSLLAGWC